MHSPPRTTQCVRVCRCVLGQHTRNSVDPVPSVPAGGRHSYLPHSAWANTGALPRVAQPITMWPAGLTHWPTYRTTGGGGRDDEPQRRVALAAAGAEADEERLRRAAGMHPTVTAEKQLLDTTVDLV